MKTPIKLSLIATALIALAGLQLPAFAQSKDSEYCSALSAKYQRYVATTDAQHRGVVHNVTNDNAMAQCQTHAGVAIPVLEKALKDAKVDLPPRS